MKKIVLTGDRPTGPLHLGHYVGSLLNRITLQEQYKQYIMVADIQALTDNFDNPAKVRLNIIEVVKDYLAVGIDPSKTDIFIQSQISEISDLTVYYLNLVTLARLERNPTVKNEIQQKSFNDSIPMGFLCYPVSQAADITILKADLVPVGDDQLPMIEQTNEIVRRFNRIYQTDCLKEAAPILSNCSRLVGIDGKAKASKSLNNAIFLSDDTKSVKDKVFSMYTDPNHLKVSDKGSVEGNVVFSYLDIFHQDKEELKSLKDHYQRGGLGDTTIKKILNDDLENLISPIRDKRSIVKDQDVMDILSTGTKNAQKIASDTIKEVKNAIGMFSF